MSISRIRLFILIAILIGTATLASNSGSIGTATALYADSARSATNSTELSAERITKHIQFLASDKLQGRRAGTPQADEAAAYIEKEFRSYGLKPSSQAGFLQPFTFVSAVKLGAKNSFQVRAGGGSHTLIVGDEFMPLAF